MARPVVVCMRWVVKFVRQAHAVAFAPQLTWGFEVIITDVDALVLREPFDYMRRWPDAGTASPDTDTSTDTDTDTDTDTGTGTDISTGTGTGTSTGAATDPDPDPDPDPDHDPDTSSLSPKR
jgi:hypothetical protein